MVYTGLGFLCFESRRMTVLLLLLLGAVVCKGYIRDYLEYGKQDTFRMPRNTYYIELISKYNSDVTILWSRDNPRANVDKKRLVRGSYYVVNNVTQRDSGRYIMRDKNQKQLSDYTLEVKANTKDYKRKHGEDLSFTFDLEQKSCNIYFFPKNHRMYGVMIALVHNGRLQMDGDEYIYKCVGFRVLRPCGISNEALQMSCNGRFEVRDRNDDTALEVYLTMERRELTYIRKPGENLNFTFDLEPNSCNIYFIPKNGSLHSGWDVEIVRYGRLQPDVDDVGCTGFELFRRCGILNNYLRTSCDGHFEVRDQHDDTVLKVDLTMEPQPLSTLIGIGIGVAVAVFLAILFCCCVKRRCCGKSSSKNDGSQTAAAKRDVHNQEDDHELVGPSPDPLIQPAGTHYPAQPSYTPTGPLVHVHPTVNIWTPYSQVSAPSAEADGVHSDPEPRFELKGMTFPSAPPLSSDSTPCDVYTSDKLNVL